MDKANVLANSRLWHAVVDEIDPDVGGRLEAMTWLVKAVGPVASVPLSIDSSDAAVLEAGLDAIDPACDFGRSSRSIVSQY